MPAGDRRTDSERKIVQKNDWNYNEICCPADVKAIEVLTGIVAALKNKKISIKNFLNRKHFCSLYGRIKKKIYEQEAYGNV